MLNFARFLAGRDAALCSNHLSMRNIFRRKPRVAFLPSILVIQTSDPTEYLPLLETTSPGVRYYCLRHGYTYETFVGIKRGTMPRPAAFNRIYLLLEALHVGIHDWVFYMDVDSYIYDPTPRLEEIIIENKDKAFVFCRGIYDGKIHDFNNGVFLVNLRHPKTLPLLIAWRNSFESVWTPEKFAIWKVWADGALGAPGDQWLLQVIIKTMEEKGEKVRSWLKVYDGHQWQRFNYSGPFVRQCLRSTGLDVGGRVVEIRASLAKQRKKTIKTQKKLGVILTSGSRPEVVRDIALQYARYGVVEDVVIWNNNKGVNLEFPGNGKVKAVNSSCDLGPDSQFAAGLLSRSDNLLIQGDGLLLPEASLKHLFSQYRSNPDLKHGISEARCNLVHRSYVLKYFDVIQEFEDLRKYTSGLGAHEIMDAIVRSATKQQSVCYQLPFVRCANNRLEDEKIGSGNERQQVLNEIEKRCRFLLTGELTRFPETGLRLLSDLKYSDFGIEDAPRLSLYNVVTKTNPTFVHAPGLSREHLFWKDLVERFFARKRTLCLPDKVTLLTLGDSQEGCFERGCRHWGVPVVKLGGQIERGNWKNRFKIDLLRDYVAIANTEYTVFCDNSDVLLVGDIQDIVARFEKLDCEMLFGAEQGMYPKELKVMRQQEKISRKMSKWEFLNSGLWMARTAFLPELLANLERPEIQRHERLPDDDQYLFAQVYVALFPRIKLDFNCSIFQNINVKKDSLRRLLTLRRKARGNAGFEDDRLSPKIAALRDDSLDARCMEEIRTMSLEHQAIFLISRNNSIRDSMTEFPWITRVQISNNVTHDSVERAIRAMWGSMGKTGT